MNQQMTCGNTPLSKQIGNGEWSNTETEFGKKSRIEKYIKKAKKAGASLRKPI